MFMSNDGWRSEEDMNRWASEANALVAELQTALEGKAELEVDLWPLPSGNPSWKNNVW
jgi:hypothetical protein